MLEKQAWIRLAPDMQIAWQQAADEGKDVTVYRADCERIAREAETENREAEAAAMDKALMAAAVRADYLYSEPSEYAEILALLSPAQKEPVPGAGILREKIRGAWIGRIAGCLLGKPLEGLRQDKLRPILSCTGNLPMNRYVDSREFTEELREKVDFTSLDPWQKCWVDTIGDAAPVDDDTRGRIPPRICASRPTLLFPRPA